MMLRRILLAVWCVIFRLEKGKKKNENENKQKNPYQLGLIAMRYNLLGATA